MKIKIGILFFLVSTQIILAQDGFYFENEKNKITIPFQFINNLIIIPIEVNGVSLNFLLDTGVEDSILFSIDDTDGISFANIQKIKIRGYGSNESFDAFKSVNNKLSINNYTDFHHTLYLVLDQNINISSQIGIPVNGIIGYHFFKNNMLKIDYVSNKITIYNNSEKWLKKLHKSFEEYPLELIYGKPYIKVNAFFENTNTPLQAKLLIDTGNSDAAWFFHKNNKQIKLPTVNFDDFLGRGFSGEVYGKRGRIKTLSLGVFELQNPLVAFPDAVATSEIDTIGGRVGSIGSEIIKRFTVVFDYKLNRIFLKKNSQFNQPFNFNMSGLEIQHQGLQWIKEDYEDNPTISNNLFDANGNKVVNNLKYKFELKPVYLIANIRKGSPADNAGFQKNDEIVKINNQNAYHYSLQQINDLLKSEEGKIIEFEIERKEKIIKLSLQLKSLL